MRNSDKRRASPYQAPSHGPSFVMDGQVRETTGPGMAPALVSRLGNPFFQQSPGRARSHGGMGLGLAAARAHHETIGARLSILSSLGFGTVVTISVPTAATATEES